MTDSNDENSRPGMRAPLTLKPRPGAVSAGTVKQSFSHGRSKTVVVETKRRRMDGPLGGAGQSLGGPSAAEKRAALDRAREAPPASRPAPGVAPGLNLSAEELRARQRVAETARAEQERRDAERAAREAARRAEEEARRVEAEAAAPAPVAEAAAPPPPAERAPEPVRS